MPTLKRGTLIPTEAEDKVIASAARKDSDAKPLTEAEGKQAKPHARMGRPLKADAKVAVKLRLDPDVLAVLQAAGPGWQTRANRILRERFALARLRLWNQTRLPCRSLNPSSWARPTSCRQALELQLGEEDAEAASA